MTSIAQTVATYPQAAVAGTIGGLRDAALGIVALPRAFIDKIALERENTDLRAANARLTDELARVPDVRAAIAAQETYPRGIAALVIGIDPEAAAHIVTIDRGTKDGVAIDDGVVDADGVVGRIIAASPFASTVLLVDDPTSRLPAVVQRGRWWGIALGTLTHVKMQYVSQDAHLRIGDAVVTGQGRSFPAGIPLGRIIGTLAPTPGSLDQTVIVQPTARLGALYRVFVLHQ